MHSLIPIQRHEIAQTIEDTSVGDTGHIRLSLKSSVSSFVRAAASTPSNRPNVRDKSHSHGRTHADRPKEMPSTSLTVPGTQQRRSSGTATAAASAKSWVIN